MKFSKIACLILLISFPLVFSVLSKLNSYKIKNNDNKNKLDLSIIDEEEETHTKKDNNILNKKPIKHKSLLSIITSTLDNKLKVQRQVKRCKIVILDFVNLILRFRKATDNKLDLITNLL